MKIILKASREKSLRRRHPWVFSGAVQRVEGTPNAGDVVQVVDSDGKFLAWAGYSPQSQIRARVWSFDEGETVDEAFFQRRIAAALQCRQLPELEKQTGVRLVHAESDQLPGITVDQFDDTLVIQLTSAAADVWREALVKALAAVTGCSQIYERSDSDVRQLEGLDKRTGWLLGGDDREMPIIKEYGIQYHVDIAEGHKTGFYLDQRNSRYHLRGHAKGKTVLNCFCYSGGFSLQALAGGATQVVSVDSSEPALQQAQRNLALNSHLNADKAEWIVADVFSQLRHYRDAGQTFDIIVLDPPKFAANTSQVNRAARAYKDINLLAMSCLNAGGLLYTFSCSGHISTELFQKIVAGAAVDANKHASIIQHLSGGADHPVALEFPESAYLKGLVLTIN